MDIETALAKGSMDRVERREPEKIYHKLSQQDWQALAPSFSFAKYLSDLGTPTFTGLNVASPEFFKALDAELKSRQPGRSEDIPALARGPLASAGAAQSAG